MSSRILDLKSRTGFPECLVTHTSILTICTVGIDAKKAFSSRHNCLQLHVPHANIAPILIDCSKAHFLCFWSVEALICLSRTFTLFRVVNVSQCDKNDDVKRRPSPTFQPCMVMIPRGAALIDKR